MKGRHAAPGWSPFWRDILLRSLLGLLLVAMAVFIWWLFSEDDLFTETAATTSEPGTTVEAPATTPGTQAPITAPAADTTAAPETTASPAVETTAAPTMSTTSTVPPPLGPDELVVKVFNANGVAGVAGRASGLLEEAGYGVDRADNHPQFLDISRVWYRAGLEREAEQLRETLIPDALVEPVPQEREGIDLIVILGRSYQE